MSQLIGGELSIDIDLLQKSSKEIQFDASSGRAALYKIIKYIEKNINKPGYILLPTYLCDSISKTVLDAGWKFDFYSINNELRFDFSQCINLNKYDAIILINYFGMVNLNWDIINIRKLNPDLIIIEDDVQAFYEYEKSIADFSFCSLRKWFPCPDGAFINRVIDLDLNSFSNVWSQYKIAGNLLKNFSEHVDDSIAVNLLSKGEELLENEYLCKASDASRIIYSNLDFNKIAYTRKENAKFLHFHLEELGICHLYDPDVVPLFVPIFVDKKTEIRNLFFKAKIFVPSHWPKTNNILNGECVFYENEISLICDQRYNCDDMLKQIEVLKNI